METKTETIGNKAYSITYAYDDKYERLMSETYHDGFKVSYGYSATGEVTTVKAKPLNKDEKTIWQLNAISALGQIEKYTQNGNLVTNMQYTAKGLPDDIKTVNGNTVLMHYDYNFTTDGDLDFRHDKVTENKEVFAYDDLNHQLTGWSLYNNAEGNNYLTRRGGGNMVYETSGNIQSKQCNQFLEGSAKTNFEYGNASTFSGPHALTGYFGNPVHKHQQAITHTEFNKVKTVALKDLQNKQLKKLDISYGVDQQRRLTEFFAADGVTSNLKRYYFDNYEEEVKGDGTTRTIHYISGGNGLAAMYISDDANGKTGFYFAHTDYQGSLTGLSDASGTIVERYAYDPWGNRRNALSWEQALNTEGKYIYTSRGYTMHEHLDDYGLINMNGRVYDPLISRFLSPDPFVQAPNIAMGYNRYAYCLNNPLIYTDPSGNVWYKPWTWLEDIMGWINDNTTDVRKFMVDVGVPDFNVGYNTATGGFHDVNGYRVDHRFLGPSYSDQGIMDNVSVTYSSGYELQNSDKNFIRNLGVGSKNVRFDSNSRVDANGGGGPGWELPVGTAGTVAGDLFYSKTYGTWMGKNFKIYQQTWGGNGFTGGKFKFGKKVSTGFKVGGYGLGIWNAYKIDTQNRAGEISDGRMYMEQSSNLFTTVAGIWGAAWGIGWESGRAISNTEWYQEAKFNYWYNYWERQIGAPCQSNEAGWYYFYQNYRP